MLSVTTSPFGTTREGHEVRLFTLSNSQGMLVEISEFGALLTSVKIPDRHGTIADVALGYDQLSGWEENDPYFGATVGRFANRIAGGKFELEGKTYDLAKNNDPAGIKCALHGGLRGFNKAIWQGKMFEEENSCGVSLSYRSHDGEEGYPGNVDLTVTYRLNEKNELTWEVDAVSDAPTPINIVQHSYWNLSGNHAQTILDHELEVPCYEFLPTCQGMIPTGETQKVENTPLDFRTPTAIGARITDECEPLTIGNGYDHCYVMENDGQLAKAGRLSDPISGRALEIHTDQPGVQIYSGNYLEGSAGKGGVTHPNRAGVCLETQNFPDAPNQAHFPNSILRPGENYRHEMVMKFSW